MLARGELLLCGDGDEAPAPPPRPLLSQTLQPNASYAPFMSEQAWGHLAPIWVTWDLRSTLLLVYSQVSPPKGWIAGCWGGWAWQQPHAAGKWPGTQICVWAQTLSPEKLPEGMDWGRVKITSGHARFNNGGEPGLKTLGTSCLGGAGCPRGGIRESPLPRTLSHGNTPPRATALPGSQLRLHLTRSRSNSFSGFLN